MNRLLRRDRATFRWALLAVAPVVAAGPLAAELPQAPPQLLGPTLILEDSVVLQETDDIFLGQPVEIFVGADGAVFVI